MFSDFFHNLEPAPFVLEEYEGVVVIGDKGCDHADSEQELRRQRNVDLRPLRRTNQKHQWTESMLAVLYKARRWAENGGSILTTVCHIEHPGSRFWSGLVPCTTTKLLAFTMPFVLTAVLPTIFGN